MRQNEYSNIDFWQNKMNKDANVWSGLFEDKPINEDSLVIAPTIINSHSDQEEDFFVVYPNPKSVLGFLQYVYLPTAFADVLVDEEDEDLFSDTLMDFSADEERREFEKKEIIELMATYYYELNLLWDETDANCLKKLEEWTEAFNEKWLDTDDIVLSFRIYHSPLELIKEMIDLYEDNVSLDLLESNLGISKGAFLTFGEESIYDNKFMSRRFLDILNNRLAAVF